MQPTVRPMPGTKCFRQSMATETVLINMCARTAQMVRKAKREYQVVTVDTQDASGTHRPDGKAVYLCTVQVVLVNLIL